MKLSFLILILILSANVLAFGDKPYNTAYDPARDALADFEMAKKEAAANGKLVLIELGGNWCIWCLRLDKFFATKKSVAADLDSVFVVIKVNVSEENRNEELVEKFPPIKGYPHFIITNSRGELLGQQDTGKLEQEKSYSEQNIKAFVAHWREIQKQ